MILSIAAIEDEAKLAEVLACVDALTWQDGKATAGVVARQVKHNQQAVMTDDAFRKLNTVLTPLISENAVLRAAARPRKISAPMVSKTEGGGHYGAHVDNAIMGKGTARMRTDISFTLFLSNPDSYEGGELVVHTAGLTQSIKGNAGDLILYPSTSIHEVRPVTKGSRIVSVGWIESIVPDHAQRELLFDLENLRTTLRETLPTGSQESLTLEKTIANLVRMWGQV